MRNLKDRLARLEREIADQIRTTQCDLCRDWPSVWRQWASDNSPIQLGYGSRSAAVKIFSIPLTPPARTENDQFRGENTTSQRALLR